tara:strand:- start:291 stop:716 length:426 start_codon:yes stop_codon:yes gene_type:complete
MKKPGHISRTGSNVGKLRFAYCAKSRFRARLTVLVMRRCSLADKCVYLRGRIFPVSVIYGFNASGVENGISAGEMLRCSVSSVVLISEKDGDKTVFGYHLSMGIFHRVRSFDNNSFPVAVISALDLVASLNSPTNKWNQLS